MPHPEIALHPIYGPDGATVYPQGHPLHHDGDEQLPEAWPTEFVAEMVAAELAAKPKTKAAKQIAAERAASAGVEPTIIETGVRG